MVIDEDQLIIGWEPKVFCSKKIRVRTLTSFVKERAMVLTVYVSTNAVKHATG